MSQIVRLNNISLREHGVHLLVWCNEGDLFFSEYDLLALISEIDDDNEFNDSLSDLDALVPKENSSYFTLRCNVKMLRAAIKALERSYCKSDKKTYLMRDNNTGLTKIGCSYNPSVREKTLQSEKPTITLFKVCDSLVEKELHELYKHQRVRGEWFFLTDKEIDCIVKKYKFHDYEK
jgi:hypothetical protein